jgi:molybdenum cofactor guanylyltransferase
MATELTGIILAGGQSKRLGFDKTALRVGGRTLLERTVELLAGLCTSVVIVSNAPEKHAHAQARLVGDLYPGKGVLGGIYSGLVVAPTDYSIVVAADMPLLNPHLLSYLASLAPGSLAPGNDVVIPLVAGQAEPLHAVYGQACLEPMRRRLLSAEPPRVISFFPEVTVRYVTASDMSAADPGLLSLFNINTPEDLGEARRLLRQRGLDLV